jgi:hypothetical protein
MQEMQSSENIILDIVFASARFAFILCHITLLIYIFNRARQRATFINSLGYI